MSDEEYFEEEEVWEILEIIDIAFFCFIKLLFIFILSLCWISNLQNLTVSQFYYQRI